MSNIFSNYWAGFKRRWNISSDWQVGIILVVFALTGTTTVYVQKWFDRWLGLGEDSSFWLKLLVFLVLVLPLYNLLLLIYGTLFGQFRFFRFFIIKFFSNLFRPFRRKTDR